MKRLFLIAILVGMLVFGCTQTEQEKIPVIENKTIEKPAIENVAPKNITIEQNISIKTELLKCTSDCCTDPAYVKKDCSNGRICENNVCKSKTPIDGLSNEAIKKWGADCKDKTTKEAIAQCILDWQENNFYWCYLYPEKTPYPAMFEPEYADCVVDMQFNQMDLASFPVSKIIEFKVRNEKIFGACYTYAVTYCAVARWNGLECRVLSAGDPNMAFGADLGANYCGVAPKNYINELGLSCDEWKPKGWKMDALHYWAEVLINGQWKRMETSAGEYMGDTEKYIIDAGMNYTIQEW